MSENPYDQHLDAFGEALRAAAPQAATSRRRRRGRPLLALGGGALVIAAVAVAVVVLPGGGSPLDPVAEAQAALGPPGDVLHYSAAFSDTESGDPAAKTAAQRASRADVCHSGPPEVWQTLTPPIRWHVKWPVAPCAVVSVGHHAFSGPWEQSYADGRLETYDPQGQWLEIKTHVPRSEAKPPQVYGDGLINSARESDPASQVRGLLASHQLRSAGQVTVGGRRLLRFTAVRPGQPKRNGVAVGAYHFEYRVDAGTFAPVTLTLTYAFYQYHRNRPTSVRTERLTIRFLQYEHLPLNDATETQLRVEPAAGTQVVHANGLTPDHHPFGPQTAAQRKQFKEAQARHDRLYPPPTPQPTPPPKPTSTAKPQPTAAR